MPAVSWAVGLLLKRAKHCTYETEISSDLTLKLTTEDHSLPPNNDSYNNDHNKKVRLMISESESEQVTKTAL